MKINKKILSTLLFAIVIFIASFGVVSAANAPADWIKAIEGAAVKIGASVVIIGWIIAGVLWLISMGNPSKLAAARMAILAAVVGTLLIIISATAETFVKTLLNIQP